MALKDRRIDERQIEAIIHKGGSVSSVAAPAPEAQPQNVQMRILPSLLARIDAIRERKPKEIRASRHAWIMEAILDKLKAEE
jgi:hypothetical protein